MNSEVSSILVEETERLRTVTNWLNDFYRNKKTRYTIMCQLKNWVDCIYPDTLGVYIGNRYGMDKKTVKRNQDKRLDEIELGIQRYLSELDTRNFLDDLKQFIRWSIEREYSNLSIRKMSIIIKTFFSDTDKRCIIEKRDWRRVRISLLPKSNRAATKDKILTKEELKIVLPYLSIHGRAMAFFLLSTGARIGASCKLKMEDIHLDEDPPWVDIKEEYTKAQVGGRIMWFSEEARDAIKEWHRLRENIVKPGHYRGSYLIGKKVSPQDLVFNYTVNGFTTHWNNALLKADRGADSPIFSRRDTSTQIKIHVYHQHTLRKFFRTNMGTEGSYKGASGIPDMIVHAWMGHKSYLDQYDKLTVRGLANIYKENMNVVTIYEIGIDEEMKAELDQTRTEVSELIEDAAIRAQQIKVDGIYLDMVGKNIGAYVGLSVESLAALTSKEKWKRIIDKSAQLEEMSKIPLDEVFSMIRKGEKRIQNE